MWLRRESCSNVMTPYPKFNWVPLKQTFLILKTRQIEKSRVSGTPAYTAVGSNLKHFL